MNAEGAPVWPGTRGTRGRPLVYMVDDSISDRKIYGSMLCYNGYDVVLVPDGKAAMRNFYRHDPDLILLDLGLPELSGLQVAQRLREGFRTQVPIIALSGFAEASMAERAQESGCTLYLEKPISPIAVLHRIEELIGRAPPSGEGEPPVEVTVS